MLEDVKVIIDNNTKTILDDINEGISYNISMSLETIKSEIKSDIEKLEKSIKKVEKSLSAPRKDTSNIVSDITIAIKYDGPDWL